VRGIGVVPISRQGGTLGAAATSGWWDNNGAIAGCIAAYQPKGAASYAASKINLANPGTHNLVDGAAWPAWAAGTGWTFAGAGPNQWLDSVTLFPDTTAQAWSLACQFANGVFVGGTGWYCPVGSYDFPGGSQRFYVFPAKVGLQHRYGNTDHLSLGVQIANGNMIVAGRNGYLNGVLEAGIMPAVVGAVSTVSLSIGAMHDAAVAPPGMTHFFQGDVIAVSVYTATLTAPEVATVSAAMAAL